MHRAKSALISLSVALALLALLEICVRLFAPQTNSTIYTNGVPIAVMDDVREYRLNPDSMPRHDFIEFDVTYHLNREGFRQADDIQAAATRPRIMLVGDSFTFGMGNEWEDTWCYLLNEHLDFKYEFINTGVPGYHTLHELRTVQQLAPMYDPEIVILLFVPGDLMQLESLDIAKFPNVQRADHVWAEERKLLHIDDFTRNSLMHLDWFYLGFSKLGKFPQCRYINQANLELACALLSKINRICTENGARLVLVGYPTKSMVILGAQSDSLRLRLNLMDQVFAKLSAAEGFTYIETLTAIIDDYKATGRDHHYRIDGHPNNHGNRFLANRIYQTYFEPQ